MPEAETQSDGLRILCLSPRGEPCSDARRPTGGAIHNRGVWEHLSRGHRVTTLTGGASAAPASAVRMAGALRKALDCARGGVWAYSRHYSFAYEQSVARAIAGQPFDLVWADGYDSAPYLRRTRAVPAILMARDSLSRYYHTLNRVRPSLGSRLAELRMRWFERRFYGAAARVVFISDADADFHRRHVCRGGAAAAVRVVPQGIDTDACQPGPENGAPEIVFAGAMDYPPNADAAVWFARAVMPLIARSAPDAVFVIAGHSPAREVLALGGDERLHGRVRVTGYVEDLRALVRSARLVVSPLRFGSGVKTKVLEAMALAKTLVATPLSMDGVAAEAERDYVRAETPTEFAAGALALLGDEARRARLGANARRAVCAHHAWPLHLARLDALIGKVIRR